MLLNLTDLSSQPLHRQISIQLARRILDGQLGTGAELPPLSALARGQHVSRRAVQLAYAHLAQEGLVELRLRKAPVVTDLAPEERKAAATRLGLTAHPLLDAIKSFSDELVTIVDKSRMCSVLFENLKKFIKPRGMAIVWRNESDGSWSMLNDRREALTIESDGDEPFLKDIVGAEEPIITRDRQLCEKLKEPWSRLLPPATAIILPLMQGDDFLGLIALGERESDLDYSQEELKLVSIFANQFATALGMANVYVDSIEKRRLEQELEAAKRIQTNLLPGRLLNRGGLEVAAFTLPSGMVGGDFYDYFAANLFHVGLVIADACGNGVPAAMLISQIQAILRSEIADGKPIHQTLNHLNRHLQTHTDTGFFATLFYGLLDTSTGILEYANAGHDFPILVRRNGQTEALASTGPALGVVPDMDHETENVVLNEGDCLVLYTDGITEATSAGGKHYGEAQLKDMAIRSRHRSSEEMLDFLRYDVQRFRSPGPPDDDMTMMVIKLSRLSASEPYAA
jgi:serine phosphatase RsbU (regulator of sigma subunit)/DNA-binding transcriptional regulator YhcF (GntR family)